MAWGIIGYNYNGPLYRFDLQACTPPLRYHLQRPFRETTANGINGLKYAEWIIRGPLIEAVRTFTNQGRLPIVMEDNSRVHRGHPDELYQHPSWFHAEAIGGGSGCTRRGD